MVTLAAETPYCWRIDRRGAMQVPGVTFASRRLLLDVAADQSLQQVVNVATLPGIVVASYAIPDVHWGYRFPISGVAATDVMQDGVVSPVGWGSTSPAGCGCWCRRCAGRSWSPACRS